MRILITGASGFIGSALADALQRRGHAVVRVGRGAGADLQADFARVPPRDWWVRQLGGIDAVVNAVGILRERPGQRFDALHQRAPVQLFEACAAAGVRQVVQISALGADEGARSRYHLSKKAADDALRRLPLAGAIVQPSLVYGAQGASAGFFNALALAPLLMLPRRGAVGVQPVHVRDVVEGIVAVLEGPPANVTLAFAGPDALSLREYLARLRRRLGARGALRVLPLPERLFRLGAAIAGKLPGSMLDDETADMLLRGNQAPANALPALLARPLTPVEGFLQPVEIAAARTQAALAWFKPLLKIAIAAVWLWTGVVSLGLYPIELSYELLARVGLHGAAASIALYGAALLDFAFGVLTLAAPRRSRGLLWGAQLALIAGYTLLISIFLPEYWLHPYGPLTKNLPMMAAIGLLWALEPPRRH